MGLAMAENTGVSALPPSALAGKPVPDENGTLGKGQFAVLIGVSAGRVSQYIADGKIDGAALVGEGRNQRIHVETAKAQLNKRLDIVQMTGNGLGTHLKSEPAPLAPAQSSPPTAPLLPVGDSIEDQIKRERLEELKARNRKLAEEEAARAGRYVEAESVQQQFGRLAGQMVTQFESGLPEIATDLATQFKLPQRDVLHALRNGFRKARGHAAEDLAKAAAVLPETIEAVAPGESEAEDDAEE